MVDSAKCFGACVVFFFACSCDAYGQRRNAGPYPRLNKIVEGKIVIKDGKPQVVLMLESYRVSNIETQSVRQRFRVEQVKNEAGEMVEQRTSLGDPVKQKELRVEVKSAGIKPKVVDTNDIKFFDLDLNEVSIEQASEKLQQLGPVFLIERGANVSAFPPAQRKALNQNCLILWSEKQIREDPPADPFANPFGGGDDDPFGGGDPLEDLFGGTIGSGPPRADPPPE